MKNYVQPGETITLLAPYAVNSGDGFLVGSIFAVAQYTAASGAEVEGLTEGVVDLKKTSAQAWTVGALVYWDNTAKEATTTAGTNKLIGVALGQNGTPGQAAANPSSTGRVRLNGAFIA